MKNREQFLGFTKRFRKISILLGICLSILVVIIYVNIKSNESLDTNEYVKQEAQKVLSLIELDLSKRNLSLSQIVRRWEVRKGTPKNEFVSDVRNYIVGAPGYQAIEWVDKDFIVRWIVPMAGNEAALNINVGFEKNRRTALERSRDLRTPVMSEPINLVQGGKGFLLFYPIFNDENFDGFILAVFRIQEWIEKWLLSGNTEEARGNFIVTFSMNDENVFQMSGWENNNNSKYENYVEKIILGNKFRVTVRPTEKFIDSGFSLLPEFILIFGVLISALLVITIYLFGKSRVAIEKSKIQESRLTDEVESKKRIEQLLESQKKRLTFILEGTNVGTWEWNVQTGETIFNERWAEIIGYKLEEIMPVSIDTWVKFAHPDDLAESNKLLEKHFAGELSYYEFESRMKHKNGSWVWVLDRGKVSTWSEDGKPLLMSGTHKDITDRKRFEEKIRQLERVFFHDILNTAGGILGFSEVLKEFENITPTEEREIKNRMVNLAHLLVNEINTQRDLISAEKNELFVTVEKINSIDLINQIIDLYKFHEVANEKEIRISPDTASLEFSSDATLVLRVLGNLLKNALEASDAGHTVFLGCHSSNNSKLFLWIHNDTVIPEEAREKIFNRSFSTKGHNRGLGTYSTKLFVEDYLKGKISFMTAENTGTKFIVELPVELK